MTKELFAEAILGKDAEEFINSELGRFLIGRADQEIEEAVNELKICYSWRTRKIKDLQNRIWRAESFQNWLGELVIRGRQAMTQLDEPEE
ncbi:hypothetical protein [Mycoplasmopsis arginini]|uniref:hypothetical protein n=1 Tax=Mycoplasmopsis arginini TaxID=2094 RepID=UPI00249F42F9|nr:hypothetical protein [Mycoplasmopsis arginini]